MYYNPDMVLDAGGTFSLVWCCSMIALDDDLMDAMHLHSSRTIPSLVPLYCILASRSVCFGDHADINPDNLRAVPSSSMLLYKL